MSPERAVKNDPEPRYLLPWCTFARFQGTLFCICFWTCSSKFKQPSQRVVCTNHPVQLRQTLCPGSSFPVVSSHRSRLLLVSYPLLEPRDLLDRWLPSSVTSTSVSETSESPLAIPHQSGSAPAPCCRLPSPAPAMMAQETHTRAQTDSSMVLSALSYSSLWRGGLIPPPFGANPGRGPGAEPLSKDPLCSFFLSNSHLPTS